ncbi:H-2 class II histocompatibility antigen, I-E beta chain-like isoform X5 [Zonotrichia albicollis]|uniref:H-2 class II histocompatibility antigen, I-E beta chain-like isoform X5 n=1 Tax=Zonotrichia albicollis TaxID=44394 RepID=UPI003D80E1B9
MGRGAAAGALLVALVVLGAPPAAGAELSGVFQEMRTRECHFINGTEKVRFVRRYIYNRKQYMMFDSDVGVFVGDTPYGETQARCCNGIPEILEDNRAAVDTFCRAGYELAAPFLTGHRGEVVPGPAGALGARGGHRRGPQRGLDLPAAGAAGNPPPARAQLQLPGGARQPGAAPEAALGDAAGRRPQQDADGHRGLRLELRLPGAGARRLPAQEGVVSCVLH